MYRFVEANIILSFQSAPIHKSYSKIATMRVFQVYIGDTPGDVNHRANVLCGTTPSTSIPLPPDGIIPMECDDGGASILTGRYAVMARLNPNQNRHVQTWEVAEFIALSMINNMTSTLIWSWLCIEVDFFSTGYMCAQVTTNLDNGYPGAGIGTNQMFASQM